MQTRVRREIESDVTICCERKMLKLLKNNECNWCHINNIINKFLNYFFVLCLKVDTSFCNAYVVYVKIAGIVLGAHAEKLI
jgi:hypothetical protein